MWALPSVQTTSKTVSDYLIQKVWDGPRESVFLTGSQPRPYFKNRSSMYTRGEIYKDVKSTL